MKDFVNKGDRSTKAGFAEGLVTAGEMNKDVIAIGADITSSVGVNLFAEKFPERFLSLGVAEQNCMGAAAGLALEGKIPVFSTYGVFSALRTTDQVRILVCYNNLRVIIGGAHAGVSVGPDGATHQSLEDIAVMRVMPNMTVLSPCDATQSKLAVLSAIRDCRGPVYLRYGREPVPDFTDEENSFIIGKAQIFKQGSDLTIMATGHLVWESLKAAYDLESQGISARVLNIHTIKPIDEKAIITAALETKAIVTAEEHQVTGGLGSAIAEVLAKHCPGPIEFIGMNDCFGESGKPGELMKKYGLESESIVKAAYRVLKRK